MKFQSNGTPLEDKYITYEELGLQSPALSVSTLWAWGSNTQGMLGVGDTSNRSSPTQVGQLVNWTRIASNAAGGSGHALAIRSDGTLWAWGRNDNGQLGLGDTVSRSSPTQVGSLTDWKVVTVGELHSLAIKANGTLWSWGINSNGELGQSDRVHRSSPVQVGSLSHWKSVSTNYYHVLATKFDGSLWVWGINTAGELGLGDLVHRSSPVQVGSLTNWKQVSTGGPNLSLAVKTDGTLWSWGSGADGMLASGATTSRSSPVQIGSLTTWKQVSAGYRFGAAIKTDGTLWSWGNNSTGQLGLGDIVHRSSPVQVGALTDWSQLPCSSAHNNLAVIKTDGTLWISGRNTQGQLNTGDLINCSSPVQIGSLTDWKSVEVGGYSIYAQRYTY